MRSNGHLKARGERYGVAVRRVMFGWWSKRRVRIAAGGVLVLAITVLLTAAYEVAGAWRASLIAATQTVATLALIIVTAAYVLLTRDLVESQRSSHRLAARLDAVARLMKAMLPAEQTAYNLQADLHPRLRAADFKDIDAGEDKLHVGAEAAWEYGDLIPQSMRRAALGAAVMLLQECNVLSSLKGAVLEEESRALKAKDTFNAGNVRRWFDAEEPEPDSVPNPRWTQLEDGSFARSVHDAVVVLVRAMREYQAHEK
jgi:hypothetical protein